MGIDPEVIIHAASPTADNWDMYAPRFITRVTPPGRTGLRGVQRMVDGGGGHPSRGADLLYADQSPQSRGFSPAPVAASPTSSGGAGYRVAAAPGGSIAVEVSAVLDAGASGVWTFAVFVAEVALA